MLAIELAKRGRARSVVGLSPAAGWEASSREPERVARFFVRMTRMARMAEPRLPAVMRSPRSRRLAFRDVMRRGELVPPAQAIELVRGAVRCSVVDQGVAALRRGTDLLPEDLDRVAAPVLLAWAQRDRVLPAATCSSRYRREIPGAEFRLLPAVGHVPMWDDSQLVAATVTEWVNRHAAVRV
jgi:pimeloyl-ACP methyl ester carboxylesterase